MRSFILLLLLACFAGCNDPGPLPVKNASRLNYFSSNIAANRDSDGYISGFLQELQFVLQDDQGEIVRETWDAELLVAAGFVGQRDIFGEEPCMGLVEGGWYKNPATLRKVKSDSQGTLSIHLGSQRHDTHSNSRYEGQTCRIQTYCILRLYRGRDQYLYAGGLWGTLSFLNTGNLEQSVGLGDGGFSQEQLANIFNFYSTKISNRSLESSFCECLLWQDHDADFVPDCNDGCPLNALKLQPGLCGCNLPDIDTDGDGFSDCVDACPNNSFCHDLPCTPYGDYDRDGDVDMDDFGEAQRNGTVSLQFIQCMSRSNMRGLCE